MTRNVGILHYFQMYSDSWFYVGIIDGANLHSGPAYFYLFDYIGEYTYGENVNRTLFFGENYSSKFHLRLTLARCVLLFRMFLNIFML